LAQALTPASECLFADHSAPVALHRGVVGGNELCRDHAFKLVSRLDADQGIDCRMALAPDFLRVRIFKEPQRSNCLIGKDVVPVVGHRTADDLQAAAQF
jgi:hypothetical protein